MLRHRLLTRREYPSRSCLWVIARQTRQRTEHELGAATVKQPMTVVPEDVLGPLNEFESKTAPRKLFVRGDVSLLEGGSSNRGGGIPAGVV